MKIAAIKQLDVGTKGFSVEAKVLNVFDIKDYTGQYGAYQRQGVLLIDGEEKMYTNISAGFLAKQDIGKPITITECELQQYKDKEGVEQIALSASKKGTITMERSTTQASTARKETVAPPKQFGEIVGECLDDVQIILNHPAIEEVCKMANNKGFSNEDVRTMLISRLIEKSRGR